MADITSRDAPAWVGITYLIYVIAYETLTLGGCGYVVFILGYSGGWFALACLLSARTYTPSKWRWL
jgi:hypothetical protein